MTNTPVSGGRQAGRGAPIRAGRQLQGRYNLLTRIAKGGMGEVWRARDIRTGTMVAAKVLRPELTGEEISLSRLRIEARNAMRARHPNIAAVLDSGESEGQGWIVMELVQGEPLTRYVGEGRRLSAADLIPVLSQTAYALDGAAQAGIVHRDIKPANIMIRSDGFVKLTDFGISYSDGQANLTAVGMVMGTAQYLAPEQAMGATATHVGDLYSLGVIAYEALAGHRPFTGSSVVEIAMAHVNDDVPALPPDVPSPIADVVYQLLEKDPEKRPPSGTALVRLLTRAAEEMGVSSQPHPLPAPGQQPSGEGEGEAPVRVATPADASVRAQRRRASAPPRPVRARSTARPAPAASTKTPAKPAEATPSPEAPRGGRSDAGGLAWRPVTKTTAQKVVPSLRTSTPAHPTAGPADPPQDKQSVGLWVIVGLVVLTVVLIIIAMIQSAHENESVTGLGDVSGPAVELEVEPWLMPTLAC